MLGKIVFSIADNNTLQQRNADGRYQLHHALLTVAILFFSTGITLYMQQYKLASFVFFHFTLFRGDIC